MIHQQNEIPERNFVLFLLSRGLRRSSGGGGAFNHNKMKAAEEEQQQQSQEAQEFV